MTLRDAAKEVRQQRKTGRVAAIAAALVMRASPGPYLEMFTRCYHNDQLDGMCRCARCRLGWSVWENDRGEGNVSRELGGVPG